MENYTLIGGSPLGLVGTISAREHRHASPLNSLFPLMYSLKLSSDPAAFLQVLLSRVNIFSQKITSGTEKVGLRNYMKTAEAVVCGLLPDSPTATSSRTNGECY